MSFPRYQRYKDSGVEWLGEVPAHWTLPKLKHFTKFSGGGTPSRENLSFWNGDIPWVSPKDMKAERIQGAEECITETGLMNSTSSLMPAGMILLVVRSGILKHTIPVAINDVPVALNQDMKALSFDEGSCLNAFFLRWVQGLNAPLLLAWAKQGATVESIEHAYLAETVVPLPPFTEQQTIAIFLDRETAKIDALIAEQQRLIGLLKEKRQAVISHAVTKGLSPPSPCGRGAGGEGVPMKDSGIEWLGEVPEHWLVSPIKYHVLIRSGGTPSKKNLEYWGGDIPWASAKDLKTEALSDTIDHITRFAIESGQASLVDVGSILVVVRGMILAKIFPVTVTTVPMAINQDLKAIQSDNELDSKFLIWLLRGTAKESMSRTDEAGHGTKALRMEAWTAMPITIPPLDEQFVIVSFLERETAKLDTLTAEAQRAIDLLKERRTALISAAVTGKIDVRGLA